MIESAKQQCEDMGVDHTELKERRNITPQKH
jgi:hypothetical protein